MEALKAVINAVSEPRILFTASAVLFLVFLFWQRFWLSRAPMLLLPVLALFIAVSARDPNFQSIITKPDNVPIVIMLFLTVFFLAFSMKQAAKNDLRIREGLPPLEQDESNQKVFTWPDLVYIEFIALILLTAGLLIWSIGVAAPIEQPANPANSPNPSKAPWYFLGLQEMLVYYDPWMAGVVLPTLVLVGLIAIPYIDVNPRGSGYFTFRERTFAITMFLFGYVILWILLIVFGTFLRGPNWNFYGPYEFWDTHKLEPLVNVNLSEYIFIRWLNRPLPAFWLVRELPGILAVLGYLAFVPPLLAKTVFKKFYERMGFVRFGIMAFLFVMMLALPIKMYLRWAFNLKYIVAIPEFFFNI